MNNHISADESFNRQKTQPQQNESEPDTESANKSTALRLDKINSENFLPIKQT